MDNGRFQQPTKKVCLTFCTASTRALRVSSMDATNARSLLCVCGRSSKVTFSGTRATYSGNYQWNYMYAHTHTRTHAHVHTHTPCLFQEKRRILHLGIHWTDDRIVNPQSRGQLSVSCLLGTHLVTLQLSLLSTAAKNGSCYGADAH